MAGGKEPEWLLGFQSSSLYENQHLSFTETLNFAIAKKVFESK